MYKKIHQFHTPEEDLTVWRYIDFTKLVDMLLSSQLYFCRSDKFEDPFEGVFKLKDYEETKEWLSDQQLTKQFYFLNCWHINENQSDAMWRLFLKTQNGIAIKSSVKRLIKAFEPAKENIYISKIYYRDFDKVTFDELMFEKQNQNWGNGKGGSINSFNYKRISFEHEKELRVYYIDEPIPHAIKDGIPRDPISHIKINVDLNSLVNELVIAPFADSWFKEMIEDLLKKLNLKFTVSQSNLYTLIL